MDTYRMFVAYGTDYIKVVNSLTRRYYWLTETTVNVDKEDLRGIATLVFVRALRDDIPEEDFGKVFYKRLQREYSHLVEKWEAEKNRRKSFPYALSPTYIEELGYLVAELPKDARVVVNLLLQAPRDLLRYTTASGGIGPKEMRRYLCRELGWSRKRAKNAVPPTR